MKQKWIIILMISIGLLLTGCSSNMDEMYVGIDEESGYSDDNTDLTNPDPIQDEVVEKGGTIASDSDVPALLERKIIYTAEMHMAVIDPLDVYNDVIDTLGNYSAYIESADITNNHYILSIRVLSSEFDTLVEDIKTTGELVSFSKSSEDITNTYSTFEARKEALEARHDRIVELIGTATDLATILALEEERFEIEAELNTIGNTLANYDSLVDYSTITLQIDEAVEEIIVLPRTETPNIYISEITKNTITIELYNYSEENVTLNVDLYLNGVFVEQYSENTFADSKVIVTFDELKSNHEYTIKVTALATEHRVSLEETLYRTTDPTYSNKLGETLVMSWNALVFVFESIGLLVTALLPFAVTIAIFFFPGRYIYRKKYPQKVKSIVKPDIK